MTMADAPNLATLPDQMRAAATAEPTARAAEYLVAGAAEIERLRGELLRTLNADQEGDLRALEAGRRY
jgi:hypothetical protein